MTLYNIGALIFGLFLCAFLFRFSMFLIEEWKMQRIVQLEKAGAYAEAVDRLYSAIWTGMPYDEVDAWERVIWYLEEYQFGQEMITEAKLRFLCRLYHGRNVRYRDEAEVENPFQGSKHYSFHSDFESPSWIQLRGETEDGRRETEAL